MTSLAAGLLLPDALLQTALARAAHAGTLPPGAALLGASAPLRGTPGAGYACDHALRSAAAMGLTPAALAQRLVAQLPPAEVCGVTAEAAPSGQLLLYPDRRWYRALCAELLRPGSDFGRPAEAAESCMLALCPAPDATALQLLRSRTLRDVLVSLLAAAGIRTELHESPSGLPEVPAGQRLLLLCAGTPPAGAPPEAELLCTDAPPRSRQTAAEAGLLAALPEDARRFLFAAGPELRDPSLLLRLDRCNPLYALRYRVVRSRACRETGEGLSDTPEERALLLRIGLLPALLCAAAAQRRPVRVVRGLSELLRLLQRCRRASPRSAPLCGRCFAAAAERGLQALGVAVPDRL